MTKIIHWLIRQKLLVNLIVVLIIVAGYTIAKNTNREAFPEVNFDMVAITTVYPGGSPDEIEKLITQPIEKKLREVDYLDKVRSYNIENVSVIIVFIEDGANVSEVAQEIKDTVELVDNLPTKAERPEVEEIKFDKTPAIDVAIYGKGNKLSYRTLRDAADEIEDFLYDINGVAEVQKFGYYDREYLIEVEPSSLTKYRLGMNTIINKLRNRNIDLPGGSLQIGGKEFILRTKGQFKNIDEIKNTVIMSNDAGFTTRIKNIATVTDTFEDADVFERFNGRRAIIFTVWKKRSADEIILVDRIRKELSEFKFINNEKIKTEFFNDSSRYTKNRLSAVIENGIVGFILLAVVLLMLLGPRMAIIVCLSIPIAFMASFFGMKAGNITLNVISLFGMIMVLGMIVDFSIVVSENSYRYMERGMSKLPAIEKGVLEVFWPVTTTLLCISTAFAPLLFLSGIMGKFIVGIPIVLIVCLTASWIIAMFIMPTFLNIFNRDRRNNDKIISENDKELNLSSGVFGKIQKKYRTILAFTLRHRYLTLLILFSLFVFSLIISSQLGFMFKPPGGAEELQIKLKFPQETNLNANLRETRKIEKIIMKLPDTELISLISRIGEEIAFPGDPKPGMGTHKATLKVLLTEEKDRERYAYEILKQLRSDIGKAKKKGTIPGNIKIEFEVLEMGPPVGKPVNVEIRGKDFKTLKKIAGEYIDFLKTVDGITDITMDLEEGKQEFRYIIDEVMATRSDISVFDIAMALNASFEGAVASSIQKGDEEIDLRVRFPEKVRKKKNSLNQVMIANQSGGLIPLSMVTRVEKQPGYTQINRLNFKRLVQVQAQIDSKKITAIEANLKLTEKFKDIENKYKGYNITYGGEQEDTSKNMGEMGDFFLIAMLVMFIILAVFFGSLLLPMVVMIAIPFGTVGVTLALWAHGQVASFMSTLGVFSLAGVIVSNTLVLVQFINNLREEGLPLYDALIEGGVIRLRPVLLTTGTTVLALFPTIYGFGGIDYFVAPLALAFGYGLIFASVITLILVPSFYHIAEDLKGLTAKLVGLIGIKMRKELYIASGKEDIADSEKDVKQDNVIKKKQAKKTKSKKK